MAIDNTLKQAKAFHFFKVGGITMEYTHEMKLGMAGQGLMEVLTLNLSENIAFFLSSHTESIIFRSSHQVKGGRLNLKFSKTGENIRDGPFIRFTRS